MSDARIEDERLKIENGEQSSIIPPPSSTLFYKIVIALLLFLGVQLWLLVMHGIGISRYQPTLIGIAAIIAIIRPLARGMTFLLDRIRQPSSRMLLIIAICIFIIASWFLYFQAIYRHRDLALRYQDEYSYRIQTRMAAQGELWKPAHPLFEFFESFQLLATPVYASIYFPGTAILYAPGIWFDWPKWMIPLLAAAGAVSLIYCVFTRLIDGVAGAFGALLAASIPIFREHSTMGMAQIPTLFFLLLLTWIWICWRKSRGAGLAIVAGATAGWLTITRPLDAVCAILPILLAVALDLRASSWPQRGRIALAALAGAMPFIAIQLIFDYHVTGSAFDTPFEFYTRQVYPQGLYGFHGNTPTTWPSWPLSQVQQAYHLLADGGFLANHTPSKKLYLWGTHYLPHMIDLLCPHRLFIVLLPVGLLGLRGKRWVVFAVFPLFVLLFFPYLFFIDHYVITVIPAILIVLVLSIGVLSEWSAFFRPHMLTFLALSIACLTISQWPEFDRMAYDDVPYWGNSLRAVDKALTNLPQMPAIVLFRYSTKISVDLEPVYNADVTWPDDAPVIRAHDLGPKNIELYRYYAQRQPERWVYIYDQLSGSLTELGPVKKLAETSP